MIESIKNTIWSILKEKEVSLALIYDREGEILWHKGRAIEGKNVLTGYGYCKSYIIESLSNPGIIDVEEVIDSDGGDLSASAEDLLVKSVLIQPIGGRFFLYVDSGLKEMFSEKDRISFRVSAEILGQFLTLAGGTSHPSGFVGSSTAAGKTRDLLLKYSLEEEPVLLTGETGVGKNHIAKLIHSFSGRPGRFIVVDTPNIQGNLFESKLFGHKKGAFTDAKFDKTGLVEEAKKGTLFFDEITEVPMEMQAKLLRFLDTRKYYMLGESTEREADVRIIAATNKDLQQAVNAKEFRLDLYYRLNVLEIKIPPLRERKEDIQQLVMENRDYLREKEIGPGFWEVLFNYSWPGNVRELLNFLKRIGIMLEPPLSGENIHALLTGEGKDLNPAESRGREEKIWSKIQAGENFWEAVWRPFIDRDLDRESVKSILRTLYNESGGNFRKMFRSLHVEEKEYRNVMSLLYKYNIDPRK